MSDYQEVLRKEIIVFLPMIPWKIIIGNLVTNRCHDLIQEKTELLKNQNSSNFPKSKSWLLCLQGDLDLRTSPKYVVLT